jgi:hypothetical protein
MFKMPTNRKWYDKMSHLEDDIDDISIGEIYDKMKCLKCNKEMISIEERHGPYIGSPMYNINKDNEIR